MNPSLVHWCCSDFGAGWDTKKICRAAVELGLSGIDLTPATDYPVLLEHGLICPICQIDTGMDPPFLHGFNRRENWERLSRITRETIETAAKFGFPNVICFTGFDREDPKDPSSVLISAERGADHCVEGLAPLAEFAAECGVTLCLEMLNTRVTDHPMKGHPGYQGDHIDYCAEIVSRIGSPAMKLLFDCYHVQVMDGDLISRIRQYSALIGHVHIAGNPGRAEPDETQEIHYPAVLRALAGAGYCGSIGIEFLPVGDPMAGLRKAVALCREAGTAPKPSYSQTQQS